jgi:dCMP deaminase
MVDGIMTDRIKWHDYFMKICGIVSERATCPRKSVGAIIVKDNRIISTGYNGAPKGVQHCNEVGCKIVNNHCVRVVHAEMNALLFAGKEAEDATLYCTCLPCEICMKLAIQSGIKKIYYKEDYNKESIQWLINERDDIIIEKICMGDE